MNIVSIESSFPDRIVKNSDFEKSHPNWEMDRISSKTGVKSRHFANEDETALDLAVKAGISLLEKHPDLKSKIDGLVFCTQSPDYVMPANSSLLQNLLGLKEELFAFDFNLACSGYTYGLNICYGLLATSVCSNILLVTADTYSKFLHPDSRSAVTLFGDGASVTWLSNEVAGLKFRPASYRTNGSEYDKFIIPGGGCRYPLSRLHEIPEKREKKFESKTHIQMDGLGVLSYVNSVVTKHVKRDFKSSEFKLEDVDLFIFHQASLVALETLTKRLKLPPNKVLLDIEDKGNTVSTSIPAALCTAIKSERIKHGDLIYLCGFGVGLSTASCFLEA